MIWVVDLAHRCDICCPFYFFRSFFVCLFVVVEMLIGLRLFPSFFFSFVQNRGLSGLIFVFLRGILFLCLKFPIFGGYNFPEGISLIKREGEAGNTNVYQKTKRREIFSKKKKPKKKKMFLSFRFFL